MMKNTFLMLMLAAFSTGVVAEWVIVGENEVAIYYIDPATIRKDGNFRRVWELHGLKQRDKSGEISSRQLVELDCKEERRRILSISSHSKPMASGKTLVLDSSPGNWSYIPPGTAGKATLEFVCAR